jgi:hypothetical protein
LQFLAFSFVTIVGIKDAWGVGDGMPTHIPLLSATTEQHISPAGQLFARLPEPFEIQIGDKHETVSLAPFITLTRKGAPVEIWTFAPG